MPERPTLQVARRPSDTTYLVRRARAISVVAAEDSGLTIYIGAEAIRLTRTEARNLTAALIAHCEERL